MEKTFVRFSLFLYAGAVILGTTIDSPVILWWGVAMVFVKAVLIATEPRR